MRTLAEIGIGYDEMGRMTPDQIYHRLCDPKMLKTRDGRRVMKSPVTGLSADEGGMVKGRDSAGNPIKAKVRIDGKSLAQRMTEAAEAKKREEANRGN